MMVIVSLPACRAGKISDAADNGGKGGNMDVVLDNSNYAKLWQEVDSFYSKGLVNDAKNVVDKIYATAKEKKNAAEFIKAIIYKLQYIQEKNEDPIFEINNLLINDLNQSQFPITPVLHSIIAEIYWDYYQSNRYRLLNRTNISDSDIKQDDMRTWDLRKIVQEIVNHYQASLKDSDKSKATKIDIYDEILIKGKISRHFRPTLYDFLAHRAVDFYMDSESGLTQPVYRFSLDNESYFSPANDFAKLDITTRDPLSFHYYALTILQDLTRFHLNDKNREALLEVDLKRLKFLNQNSTLPNKDTLYEKSLLQMLETYGDLSAVSEVYYDLASFYDNQGDKYKPVPENTLKALNSPLEQYKWYKKKAHDLCNQVINKYGGIGNVTGVQECIYLRNQIEAGELNIIMENAIPSQIPSPALVKYKNLDNVYLKIVKTNRDEMQNKRQLNLDNLIKFYLTKPVVAAWEIHLINDGDFQVHSSEIKIPSLALGEYVLLASNNNEFAFERDQVKAVAYSYFTISDIAYINRHRGWEGLDFYLLHRQTGQPLSQASAQVWYEEFNQTTKNYVSKKGMLYTTDENGYLFIPFKSLENRDFQLELIDKTGKDHLFLQQHFYSHGYNPISLPQLRTIFFTDRGIYRPGQPLYFKGIMIQVQTDENGKENNHVLPKQSTRVTFYDVNHQEVSHLDLVTNDFGTFSGTFQIPVGRLNGDMTISDGHGEASFSVEEYKRPNFQVIINPLTASYRLGEPVTITGKAVAYAGYNIDNADVKYRVVRETFYPYPFYYYRFWYPPFSPSMEIVNGITKTNANGGFEITFNAVPDTSISKDIQPAFNFTVNAEITDINGETQQTKITIPIGYISLKIGMDLPEQLDKDKNEYDFTITSTTLSGEFIPATGEIAIYKLKEPSRIFRKKLWDSPDRFTMSRNEYYKLFPHDSYEGEDNFQQWEKEKRVFNEKFDTKKGTKFQLPGLQSWETGKYVMEMSALDNFGNPVKQIVYFTLYSGKGKTLPGHPLEWFALPRSVVEPGDTAVVLVGSAAQDVHVIFEIELNGKIIEKKFLTLNNEQKRLEIPILENYRGNIGLHLIFVKYNRVLMYNQAITVPWTNKQLDITFETFRNKLLPGEHSEWRLKISGKKGPNGEPGAKVEAEMLATLYDASLDAFRPLFWIFNIYQTYYSRLQWEINNYFGITNTNLIGSLQKPDEFPEVTYDQLNWFDFSLGGGRYYKSASMHRTQAMPPPSAGEPMLLAEVGKAEQPLQSAEQPPAKVTPAGSGIDLSTIKARTNLQETAFFYPHLRTNENGEIIIAFTIPEALTKWKMMGFAHTRDLKYGFVSNELVTQKDLMVIPNVPRFFREGDTLELETKITNLSNDDLSGKVKLMLFDAFTMQPVDVKFKNQDAEKAFNAPKGQSVSAAWKISIPDDVDTVVYRIVASAGNYSDGEEQAVPILKNRMLVTESLPLPVNAKQTKDFQFTKLINSSQSTTIKQYKLTLEFISNPVWYVVQAIPYLMEYPYECLEQLFSRYYANSIATYIVNQNPNIKRVFDIWQQNAGSGNANAFLSNLEKNQELKLLLLEETPWVLNARDESERKRRIALLFDLNKMTVQLDEALQKIINGQMPSGAWPWFKGMGENRYITQHIVCGFAYLDRLNVVHARENQKIWTMLTKAVQYLDRKLKEDYDLLLKSNVSLDQMHINYDQVFYLYGRSYFKDIKIDDSLSKAFAYYMGQAEKYWLKFNKYMQGMIALSLDRSGKHDAAVGIVQSIKQYALFSEELGMYWKEDWGYYWYQSPIEAQALLIEVFNDILNDQISVEKMKTWLLKQKQTQDWGTTKATANACYALLLTGKNLLTENQPPDIVIGKNNKIIIEPLKMDNIKVEAGTGYFRTSWSGNEVTPDMGYIRVTNNNDVAAWGSLYWQYFENLDKITQAQTPLQLNKKLFVEKLSDTGPVLKSLDKNPLQIGDKVRVRIELRVDRDMEYVYMRDMRASGFEPLDVISGMRWQGGLYYYQSTRDASTDFFFDWLHKGTYVFEYSLRVNQVGDFSNGITTIQSMYAPEFASHSEGVRVQVLEK